MIKIIPTYKQFKSWSIPSKVTYIAFIFMVLGGIYKLSNWCFDLIKNEKVSSNEIVRDSSENKLSIKDTNEAQFKDSISNANIFHKEIPENKTYHSSKTSKIITSEENKLNKDNQDIDTSVNKHEIALNSEFEACINKVLFSFKDSIGNLIIDNEISKVCRLKIFHSNYLVNDSLKILGAIICENAGEYSIVFNKEGIFWNIKDTKKRAGGVINISHPTPAQYEYFQDGIYYDELIHSSIDHNSQRLIIKTSQSNNDIKILKVGPCRVNSKILLNLINKIKEEYIQIK